MDRSCSGTNHRSVRYVLIATSADGPTAISSEGYRQLKEHHLPRFRFHIFNDAHTIDFEGKELLDLDAARACAIEGARGIMADEMKSGGKINLNHWIEIEDEQGDMTVVLFDDAVNVIGVASAP